jgi:putative endonuclease
MAGARENVAPPGDAAESLVARALEDRGWLILDRRLRVGRLEVDILARRDDVVAIVEVRGRRMDGWVEPLDSLTYDKRKKIARAARVLWTKRFAKDRTVRLVRIDAAAVTWRDGAPTIEIVEGAIDPATR